MKRSAAPHLRIVDEAIWSTVQERLEERRCGPKSAVTPNKTRLLSGLLKCSVCGSGVVSAGSKHGRPVAQCTRVRESGDCSNRQRIYLDTIESAVASGLREQLGNPALIAEVVRDYHAERRRLASEGAKDRAAAERRLGDVRGQVERLVDALANGSIPSSAVGRRLGELEAEEARLSREVATAAAETDIVTMHPKAVESYLAQVERLSHALRDKELQDAFRIVRQLVDHVVIYPRAPGEPVVFDIAGKLAALIDPGVGPLVPGAASN